MTIILSEIILKSFKKTLEENKMLGIIKHSFKLNDYFVVPNYKIESIIQPDLQSFDFVTFLGLKVYNPKWIITNDIEFPAKPWQHVMTLNYNPKESFVIYELNDNEPSKNINNDVELILAQINAKAIIEYGGM